MQHLIPSTGFLRLHQIIGNKKEGIPAIIPVSRSKWWEGVKSKKFPQPIKLSPGCTVWTVESIMDFIKEKAAEI